MNKSGVRSHIVLSQVEKGVVNEMTSAGITEGFEGINKITNDVVESASYWLPNDLSELVKVGTIDESIIKFYSERIKSVEVRKKSIEKEFVRIKKRLDGLEKKGIGDKAKGELEGKILLIDENFEKYTVYFVDDPSMKFEIPEDLSEYLSENEKKQWDSLVIIYEGSEEGLESNEAAAMFKAGEDGLDKVSIDYSKRENEIREEYVKRIRELQERVKARMRDEAEEEFKKEIDEAREALQDSRKKVDESLDLAKKFYSDSRKKIETEGVDALLSSKDTVTLLADARAGLDRALVSLEGIKFIWKKLGIYILTGKFKLIGDAIKRKKVLQGMTILDKLSDAKLDKSTLSYFELKSDLKKLRDISDSCGLSEEDYSSFLSKKDDIESKPIEEYQSEIGNEKEISRAELSRIFDDMKDRPPEKDRFKF